MSDPEAPSQSSPTPAGPDSESVDPRSSDSPSSEQEPSEQKPSEQKPSEQEPFEPESSDSGEQLTRLADGPRELADPELLDELEHSLGRLEEFASKSKAENTIRAYAADLEDFRHWCDRYGREWLPAEPETIGLYLGARADDLSLATLERRLAAIASVHKEEGYDSPATVAEGPLRPIWKGIVREKTRQQDGATPLLVEDLKKIIEHLPCYNESDDGPTGRLTLTSLRDRAILLVGWTGALRRSEIVTLTTQDLEFIAGEGVNITIRQSKTDQEAEGMTKGLPYGSNTETCPVTALRTWIQAASRHVDGPFDGPIFRRFYRGESIGSTALTAQYVSKILKRHAERVGLDPEGYSAHSLRAGFITQAIRAGKAERRVKEHSGHKSWETFNRYVEKAGTFQDNPAEDIGL